MGDSARSVDYEEDLSGVAAAECADNQVVYVLCVFHSCEYCGRVDILRCIHRRVCVCVCVCVYAGWHWTQDVGAQSACES